MSFLGPIRTLAAEWYRKLDEHAPAADFASSLAGTGFELRVPEGTFHGFPGFQQWYERALGLFFDEEHTVKAIDVAGASNHSTTVSVVVRWEASTWAPPDAKSRRIRADAHQTWVVRTSVLTGSPEILSYAVDRIEYAHGSARLRQNEKAQDTPPPSERLEVDRKS